MMKGEKNHLNYISNDEIYTYLEEKARRIVVLVSDKDKEERERESKN